MPFQGVEATFWALLAPFVAAAFGPWLTRHLKHNAAWILAVPPAAIFLFFLSFVPEVSGGAVFRASMPWVPSLQVEFSVFLDGLSVLFALLISGIGTFVVLYAGGYLKGHAHQGRFFSFLFLFMGAMLGVVLADNFLTLFVFWELTSITSFLLIGFDHLRTASRRSAIQALVVTGAGGMALLAGLLLTWQASGTMEMSQLLASGDVLRESSLYLPVFILICLGAFTKSAQFPFHFWLPNAMEAPTPVSAYLHSATMVKAGVYLLMRMHPVLGDTTIWMTVLPLFGGVTLLVGTFLGLRQTDLKLVLAYTTVASLGLLVMLTGTSSAEAIRGAVLYLFAHSLFKGALFMAVGTIDHEAGTRDMRYLGGLRKAMPITFTAALLAALSMAGLPPFLGFVAKEVLYNGTWTLGSGAAILTLVAVAGNAMMFALAAIVALKPFLGKPVDTPKHAHEGPILLYAGPVVLAACGLIAGLFVASAGHLFADPMTLAVSGEPVHGELHLIPAHINAALFLSLGTIALGITLYIYQDKARAFASKTLETIGWGPDKGFDQFINACVILASKLTRTVQTGSMVTYMRLTFSVLLLVLFVPMIATASWPSLIPSELPSVLESCILALALIGLYAVLTAKNRVTAMVSLGVSGFAVAVIYFLFGAPDLSFTQFMVETLSVVILALVMTRLNLHNKDSRGSAAKLFDAGLATLVGLGFTLALAGVTQQPFDASLSEFFTQFSRSIAHGRNIVNVILVDFRGFDTIGEISVVMVTGLCVLALIRVRSNYTPPADPEANKAEANS
ncbi:putative monovalent cation/H+ antiporter subunit A [Polycladidibacter hongkongensis]|uniref:putative monovalent cation/H+ antiporter subunit A n=1 Tax=Polycladidibacter hongkongensis TaxID=1647556 RepID=UPI00082EA0DD|nr:putative monovalent cation/H+ antiporter subunit A [Pseudovibrio hongkongensis]